MVAEAFNLPYIWEIFVFLFGTVFGSFFNVCISRIPKKESLIPDSHCPNCNYKIKAYDNIPILSFIFLRGKCRNCGLKISWQYPLVELFTGVIFLLIFIKFGFTILLAKYLIFFSALLIIFVIDLNEMIIPDVISLPLILVGFIFAFFTKTEITIVPSLLGAIVGFLFFYSVAVGYEKITKTEGMGGGDIKLIAAIGAFLGMKGVLITIIFSAIFFILYFVIAQKRKDSQIPYGPFLAIGAFIHTLYGSKLWEMYLNFSFEMLDKLG